MSDDLYININVRQKLSVKELKNLFDFVYSRFIEDFDAPDVDDKKLKKLCWDMVNDQKFIDALSLEFHRLIDESLDNYFTYPDDYLSSSDFSYLKSYQNVVKFIENKEVSLEQEQEKMDDIYDAICLLEQEGYKVTKRV